MPAWSGTAQPGAAIPGWIINWPAPTRPSSLVNGQFIEKRTGLPYNPESGRFAGSDYTLVGPDDTAYEISTRNGVQTIITPTLKRLLVSDSGIVAPDGSRLSFQWDHQGRLSAVITEDGARVVYAYDSQGNLMSVYKRRRTCGPSMVTGANRRISWSESWPRPASRAGTFPIAMTVVS